MLAFPGAGISDVTVCHNERGGTGLSEVTSSKKPAWKVGIAALVAAVLVLMPVEPIVTAATDLADLKASLGDYSWLELKAF